MKFWRLHHPDYPSSAAARLINGEISHPYRLPGIKCGDCRTTWGGSRVLPYELPESLRQRVELRQPWPLEDDLHRRLRETVQEELRAAGRKVDALRPGDAFQPVMLDVAAPPESDFVWGAESVIVAPRIFDLLTTVPLRGATFAPATLRAGRRVSADRRAASVVHDGGAGAPSFYQLIVRAESEHPPGVDPVSYCASCGRRAFDHDRRQLVMRPDMWRGDQIFLLATTMWIMVTDPVKQLLERLQPTNVRFVDLEPPA